MAIQWPLKDTQRGRYPTFIPKRKSTIEGDQIGLGLNRILRLSHAYTLALF